MAYYLQAGGFPNTEPQSRQTYLAADSECGEAGGTLTLSMHTGRGKEGRLQHVQFLCLHSPATVGHPMLAWEGSEACRLALGAACSWGVPHREGHTRSGEEAFLPPDVNTSGLGNVSLSLSRSGELKLSIS